MPTINYTDRDFETIRQAMILRLQAAYPDTWRDFTESNIGMALMELVAHAFDVASYMLDSTARNFYIGTVEDREAMILLCRLIGYKPRAATSATVVCTATLAAMEVVDIIVLAGTTIETPSGVVFEVLEDQTIPSGTLGASITLAAGQTITETSTATGASYLEIKLEQTPVIDGSISVQIDGFPWEEVDSLVYSDHTSSSYEIRYDSEDAAYVKFGDSISGQIPAANSEIEITYRVGGGKSGNIPIGDITQSIQGLKFASAPQEFVQVTVQNTERGSGGEDRETMDHVRYWAPKKVAANSRAVTTQDFDTLATLFSDPVYGSPAYAKAELKQRIPELNTVMLYLWARDGYGQIVTPSTNLKTAVQAYFDNNRSGAVRLITVKTEVADGNIVYTDISTKVTVDGSVPDSEVAISVRDALRNFFDSPSNQPGSPIRLSKIYSLIQAVDGVEHALINRVVASYVTDEVVGTTDGVTQQFDYTTHEQPLAGTVVITAGEYRLTDDGNGSLLGDIDSSFENTIDYDTGVVNFALKTPVPDAEVVRISYRYPLEYQQSESGIWTGNAVTKRFRGKLLYPPLMPGSVAFTDGNQTITDNGAGELTGDVTTGGATNYVDYDTGAYDLTFFAPPPEGTPLAALYRQQLSVNAGDIPILSSQLAISGIITVSTASEEL